MTGAEVVERDLHPEVTRRRDLTSRGRDVGQNRSLGDLEADEVRVATRALQQLFQLLRGLAAGQVRGRHVAPDAEVVAEPGRRELARVS